MRLKSNLKSDAYLSAMKEQMEGHFEFGKERFTGFFLGRAFSVTHHCGAEWNRKITNEKNTAVGFVRESADGCIVSFIRLRGLLSPPLFLACFAFVFLLMMLGLLAQGQPEGVLPQILGFSAVFSLILTAVCGVVSAFMECLTEAGQEGRKILNALLLDPSDVFSYTNNINHVDF